MKSLKSTNRLRLLKNPATSGFLLTGGLIPTATMIRRIVQGSGAVKQVRRTKELSYWVQP